MVKNYRLRWSIDPEKSHQSKSSKGFPTNPAFFALEDSRFQLCGAEADSCIVEREALYGNYNIRKYSRRSGPAGRCKALPGQVPASQPLARLGADCPLPALTVARSHPPVGSFPKNSALAKTVLFGVRSHRRFPKSWLANDVSGPVDSEKKRAK